MSAVTEVRELSSRIHHVRLFRSGALVTRRAAIELPADGALRVRIVDLPLTLVDSTVRLTISDGAPGRVGEVALGLDAATRSSARGTSDEEARDALKKRRAELAARLAVARGEITRLDAVTLASRPGIDGERAPEPADATARVGFARFRREAREGASATVRGLERELSQVERELAATEARIARAVGQALPRPEELRKTVAARISRGAAAEGPHELTLELEYFVAAARWAPAYVLRVSSTKKRARLELRAMVAQETGEDWRGVRVTYASAHPLDFHELPELTSLRYGRAQPPVKKRKWRPLAEDPTSLFADYGRALKAPIEPPRPHEEPAPEDEEEAPGGPADLDAATLFSLKEMGALEQARGEALTRASTHAASDMPMPMAMAPPASMLPRKGGLSLPSFGFGGGGGAPPMQAQAKARSGRARQARAQENEAPREVEADVDERLLQFGDLRMPAFTEQRGRLVLLSRAELYRELSVTETVCINSQLIALVEGEERAARDRLDKLPKGFTAPAALDGFDHAFDGEFAIDVPSDGEFHSVALAHHEANSTLRHVVVPREASDVFRMVELDSPFDVPLLRGPCDVYLDGAFLMTVDLATVAPRGKLRCGLGVDQAVKVARNTSFQESTTGLMSGTLVLRHSVKIELESHRSEVIDLEVRERLPQVPEREEDVKLEVLDVSPAWQPWEPAIGEPSARADGVAPPLQGGYAWRASIEPRKKRELTFSYLIKIPAKLELVGGNRRD
ncbi:MAG: DUF4139 domain-containing protein [Polyangiaceae bacterium]